MQSVVEYPRCHGICIPHPLQEPNPRLPSDFDPRAPSDAHLRPPNVTLFHESTEAASFFPSLVQYSKDAQVASLPGFSNELKEHAAVFCQGEFGLISTESSASKSDGQQEALHTSKMSSSASPFEGEKQRAPSTSTSCGDAVVTGVSEPASNQGSFHASDPKFHADAHPLRRLCPLTSRNNPYIDALKVPSWPQLLEPAGTGYSVPGEEWSTHGIVGKGPSFGALPNYHHHQPGYKADQLGGMQQPTFHSSPIFHQRARNAPAFLQEQLQPAARGNAVDYMNNNVGLFGSVDAYSTDQGVGIYERSMWPRGYRIEDSLWASERLVGKSQSMRALYCCHKEENEALRQALYSMRRAADHETRSPGADMNHLSASPAWAKDQLGRAEVDARISIPAWAKHQMERAELQELDARINARRQDRSIARDAGEGRTVSMRERGRWGEQDKVGGEGFSYPIRSREGSRCDATRKHVAGCWCREDGGAAFCGGPRLYFGGGAQGESRWQEAENEWLRWGDGWQGREGSGDAGRPKAWQTSGGGGAIWGGGASGGGVTMKEQLTREGIGGGGGKSASSGVDESRCAMCDGKLRRLRNPSSASTKKLGLPLRLCPACHPRPASSLPPSTTKASNPSPPPSSPPLRPASASARSRYHAAASVATAISIACKPNIAAAASSSAARKKSKTRIVDLCRHLVGLSIKPGAA